MEYVYFIRRVPSRGNVRELENFYFKDQKGMEMHKLFKKS